MKATEREKALIFALAAGGLESWQQVYILAKDKSPEQYDSIKIRPIISRYKQREDIQKCYNDARAIIQARDERIKQAAREEARREIEAQRDGGQEKRTAGESEHTKPRKAGPVDYYNPANQRERINAIIEAAQDDPKTQLDAIKAIQQTQRDDRQAAKDDKIQRFFTPIQCKTCPLKLKKAKKTD